MSNSTTSELAEMYGSIPALNSDTQVKSSPMVQSTQNLTSANNSNKVNVTFHKI